MTARRESAIASVLIVDDHVGVRETLRAWLERDGHEVRLAGNGDEALAVIGTFVPAVVVTDIVMPDRDGIETIFELRRRSPSVKIVAISGAGAGAGDYLDAARILGADVTFTKPLDLKELCRTVRSLVGADPPTADEARSEPPWRG